MNERMNIGQLYPHPVMPVPVKQKTPNSGTHSNSASAFKDILDQKMLKFSHHAEIRMQQRGIRLQQEQLDRLESAIDKAAAKGSKDSLLLMSDMAFIVNVKNRTVVTALEGTAMKDNVFTQIDSAIIIS